MAVVFEERKDRLAVVNIVGWIVILIIAAVAVYYIFFRWPEIVDVRVPPQFQNIQSIVESEVELSPESVINNPAFQIRRQHVPPPVVHPENFGRANPFIPI